MNYLTQIQNITKEPIDPKEIVIRVCDLVIPKIMYITIDHAKELQQKFKAYQAKIRPQHPAYFMWQMLRAILDYRQANYQRAIDQAHQLAPQAVPELLGKHVVLKHLVLGTSHRSLGNREQALNAFQEILDLLNTTPSSPYQQYTYFFSQYQIGEIFGELADFEGMRVRHLDLYKAAKAYGNIDVQNRSLNGMGRAFLALKDFKQSMHFFKLADYNAQHAANPPFIARNLHDMGTVYRAMGQYDNALKYYQRALNLRKELKLINASVTTKLEIARIYFLKKNYHQSIEVLNRALALAEPLQVKEKTAQIFLLLSNAYEAQNNFEPALSYHKKYVSLKSAIENVIETQVESQKTREINTQLIQQKQLIESQKKEIEATVAKLAETNKYLQNFASLAAHDLKAPIRVASSFTERLFQKRDANWDEEEMTYIKFITQNVKQLGSMIDDLLALSRLDQNLPPPQKVDLSLTIQDIQSRLSQKIDQTEATITQSAIIPPIQAHLSLVTQLLQNLIDNALKHHQSDQKPIIDISYQTFHENPSFIEILVTDNGYGIPQHQIEQIFELFHGKKDQNSNGIGLAICKKIVGHYGGQIWANSTIGKGTSFHFTLPLFLN